MKYGHVILILLVSGCTSQHTTPLPESVVQHFPLTGELPSFFKPYVGITAETFSTLASIHNVTPPLHNSALTLYSLRHRPLIVGVDSTGKVAFARSHQYLPTAPKDVGTNRANSYLGFRVISSTTAALVSRGNGYFYPGIMDIYTGMVTFVPRREPWMRRTLHHDVRWNPRTETFLVLWLKKVSRYAHGAQRMMNDNGLYEIDLEGQLVWELDLSTLLLPYWVAYARRLKICNPNDKYDIRCTDYVHINTAFWDVEDDAIYVNSRRLSTFFKITKSTKRVEWAVGFAGDCTLWDDGRKVDSLFSGAHEVTKIGPRLYALLDNNAWSENECVAAKEKAATIPGFGQARIIVIKVAAKRRSAELVYSFPLGVPCSPYMGSVARLPGGNLLGHMSPELTTVEVDPLANKEVQRTVVTVAARKPTNWLSFRAHRLYRRPIIAPYSRINGTVLRLTLWDNVPRTASSSGHITVYAPVQSVGNFSAKRIIVNGLPPEDQLLVELLSEPVHVRAHWFAEKLRLDLPRTLPYAYVVFTNADGVGNVVRVNQARASSA
eukprot:TRINITY_DN20859_c0_g1_i2.p1 TRINITY_DN20859_c0_g1~~TRINITY_DN20859_c0_g1_i2.p1  ORF type:complete len:572 (-),score=87.74 TRINITY_DN20859_c0_g1_i2:122-1768(-)